MATVTPTLAGASPVHDSRDAFVPPLFAAGDRVT